MLDLTVPLEPRPLARPRVVRTRSGRSRTYTPPESEAHKLQVAEHVRKAMRQRARGTFPLQGPLCVRLDFFLGNARRVDVDNLVKMVFDAITDARAWQDDSQVVSLVANKYAPAAAPRTWITVEPVKPKETA